MKLFLVGITFFLWSVGSTYWYVCKIKSLCHDTGRTVESVENKDVSVVPLDTSVLKKEIKEDMDLSVPISFKLGSPEPDLNQEQEDFLTALADYMLKNESKTLVLIGHTDDIGEETKNLKLGAVRAESLKNYLVVKGVKANRIETTSKGESSPLTDNSTPEGREKNRRVEFIFK